MTLVESSNAVPPLGFLATPTERDLLTVRRKSGFNFPIRIGSDLHQRLRWYDARIHP
jgi:hypothetical protein